MARYESVADDARKTINDLINLVPDESKSDAARLIAYVYNYGIRTCPRACQSTVRYRAVTIACRDLPVKISMREKLDTKTGRKFNVLIVNEEHEPAASDD